MSNHVLYHTAKLYASRPTYQKLAEEKSKALDTALLAQSRNDPNLENYVVDRAIACNNLMRALRL